MSAFEVVTQFTSGKHFMLKETDVRLLRTLRRP